MRAILFEDIEALNEYLKNKSHNSIVDVKFQSSVVEKTTDVGGKTTFTIVDRFLVIEK